ncbi:MAG: hypothetical protein PHY09_16570 [Desulfuromonadaceae bacterium]|nr:hypothetical protein [Desulfuromonadaceae bacterium]MDD5106926.1 hypothetical protein [Desulfuromonadaceae bacterium]
MTTLDEQSEDRKQRCVATTQDGTAEEQGRFISVTAFKWLTGALLAYFGIRLLYFALNISAFVPPDEVTHAGISKVFAQTLLFPDNSPATYEFGLVTNIPWLYYWTMGKLLHLNFFGMSDLVFLRLLNIPLAFGTLYFVRQTLLLLTRDRLTQLLLIVAVTNTAMFSLLSASVSYDNLTNLFAAMAVYYLAAFIIHRSGTLFAAAMLAQLAGCLTKVTFLPLVLVLDLLLIVHEFKNFRVLPGAVKIFFRTLTLRGWLLVLSILICFGLNLKLYGGNYLRHGTLLPSMSIILSPAAAMNYRLDARGTIFNDYKDGKISYMDALILTGRITHPGDKADTFYLLMNYNKMKSNPQLWMGPFEYVGVWFENMTASIFGIKGHLVMIKDSRNIIPLYALMALAGVGFLARWRPRKSDWLPLFFIVIACFYAGYFLYNINYEAYLNYGAPGLTLYGRYLFPIMAPVAVLMCHYLLQLFRPEKTRLALALVAALLFIAYDFPWFLMHVTPEWYQWLPR